MIRAGAWWGLSVSIFLLSSCSADKSAYFEEGNRNLQAGKYRAAEIAYRKALRKDPAFGAAYQKLAEAHLKQEKFAQAVNSLRRAVSLMPSDLAARISLMDLLLPAYFSQGSAAKPLLEEVRSLHLELEKRQPAAFDTLRIKAYLALADGNRSEAIALLRKANQAKPLNPQVVRRLAELLMSENQGSDGEALLEELLKVKADDVTAHDLLYVYHRSHNRVQQAEAVLKRKIAAFPKVATYRLQLATHYDGVGKPSDSAAQVQYLLERRPDFPQVHLHVGDYYLAKGNWEKALENYQSGVRLEAETAILFRMRMFEAFLAQGETAKANEVLDLILKEDPKNSEARIAKATLRIGTALEPEIEAAVAEFREMVNESPENAAYRFNLGRAYMVSEDMEGARRELAEAVKVQPEFSQARLALSDVLVRMQQFKEGLRQVDEVLARTPDHAQARLIRVGALIGLESYFVARNELVRLMKDVPQYAEAEIQLALLNVLERRYAEAEAGLRKYYRSGTADTVILRGLAELYMAQGQDARAVDLLQNEIKAISEPRPAAPLRLLLAEVEARAGRMDKAIEQLQQVLPYALQPAQVRYRMAAFYAALKKSNEALHELREARKLAPNDTDILISLAGMLQQQERYAEAQPLYAQILQADGENPVVLNNAAYNLAESGGDLDQALAMAQRALAKVPGQPNFSDTVGWIYLKKNMPEAAVQIFENLTRAHPTNSTFRYHLGAALLLKGEKERAKRELQAALTHEPGTHEEGRIRSLMAKIG
jgi:tetratricopeptide (TPR) repeat protein